jgi:hypothetical protein
MGGSDSRIENPGPLPRLGQTPSVVTQNRPTINPGTLTLTRGPIASVSMSHVLSEEKKQQVIALGKLGWPPRRIEQATGVRRETAGAYFKAAGGRGRGTTARCLGTASVCKTGQ